jgi:predicted secreted Zn-dependent protease
VKLKTISPGSIKNNKIESISLQKGGIMKINTRGPFKVKNNRIIKVLWLAIFCVLAFSLSPLSSAQAATWYVDVDVTGGDGTAWATAYDTIQEAIDAANPTGDEIWVKEGTYTLTTQINVNKTISIYGGFPDGSADPGWDDRDWEINVTTVDGNLAADHCFYITEDATVDGFTIMRGFADGPDFHQRGGGVFIAYNSATIANCIIESNEALTYGGGIYSNVSPSLTITNCIISGNTAGENGGGICMWTPSDAMITRCIFLANDAQNGGAIYVDTPVSTIITNCTFSNNFVNTGGSGGGIYNIHSDSIITNCLFSGQTADYLGGAIRNSSSDSVITNCTFTDNEAYDGGAIHNLLSNPVIKNCILWGDTATNEGPEIFNVSSTPNVSYSNIAGPGYTGNGNISQDPVFAGVLDYRIAAGSPCIDAADNDALPADLADLDDDLDTGEPIPFDLDDNPRRFDDTATGDTGNAGALGVPIVDMGAYEYFEAEHTVTFLAGANGGLTGDTTQVVDHGSDCTEVTAVPDTGYHFVNWTGDYTGTDNPLTVENVTADMTITANFEINTYTVTFESGANGSLTGDLIQEDVPYGGSCTAVTAVPATNYHFDDWTGDYTGTDNPLTVTSVTSNMTITANFAIDTYTVTFVAGANGSITGDLSQVVAHGSDCTAVTAVEDLNYHFDNWTGDYTGTDNPLTVTGVTADMTINANFAIDTFTVTFEAGANGSLTGDLIQEDVPYGGSCTAVTAVPDTNYHLVDWTDPGGFSSTDNPLTVNNVISDMTITANFTIDTYTVTFVAGANGSITGDLSQVVAHGSDCTAVTAVPGTGYHFVNWTGDYTGTANPLTVTSVTSDMTITANFAINTYTVTFVSGANGSITGDLSQVVAHGSDCTEVTAVPAANYHFDDWTGDYTGPANPLTVTNVTSNMTITANFAIDTYTVTFVSGANGSITGDLSQVVAHGSDCTAVTAVPAANYHFDDWTGDYTGTDNPLTVTNVTSDMTITANFAIDTYTVTFVPGANGNITGDLSQVVAHGSDCTEVTAVPYTNYHLVDWTGDYTGTANPLTVTNVTSNMTITANFAIDTYPVYDELALNFGVFSGGLWDYDGVNWAFISGSSPEDMAGWSGGLALDFGASGLWNYDGSTWTPISGSNVEGITNWANGLAVDFGASGVWSYDGTTWTSITGSNPDDMAGWSGGLAMDFGASGVWSYDGTTWTPISGSSPEGMVAWAGGLALDFGASGLWNYDGTTWAFITGSNAEGMANWANGLAIDFGASGVWSYDGTTWDFISGSNPEGMLGWSSGLAMDFGASGVWSYDGTTWAFISSSDVVDMDDVDLY